MSRESEMLSEAVAEFGEAMRRKLWKKERQGYRGWDDTSDSGTIPLLQEKLQEHVRRYFKTQPDHSINEAAETDPKQLVDIANLAMMLWRLEEKGTRT